MHWKLREGRLVYLYEYMDRDEALQAAGLSGLGTLALERSEERRIRTDQSSMLGLP